MKNIIPVQAPVQEQAIDLAPTPVEVPLGRTGQADDTSAAPQEFPGDANATFPGEAAPEEPTQEVPTQNN